MSDLFDRGIYLFLVLMLCLGGCSSENNSKSNATKPAEQLDPQSAQLYPAQKKTEAKNFSVELISGENFQLSDHRGKVVLLNIWATWCGPCIEEIPHFVDLYSTYRDKSFVILGVSVDKQGPGVVVPFIEKHEVNYPVVIDNGTIMDKYGPTMGIPTTYVIGKEGDLRYFAVGALTKKELEPRIQKLLAE
jgi:peroxiredoxin